MCIEIGVNFGGLDPSRERFHIAAAIVCSHQTVRRRPQTTATITMEDKWIQVTKELAAAATTTSKTVSVEKATLLLAGVQDMERAAHVVLLHAVIGAAAPNNETRDDKQVLECVKPPAIIPEDDLVQVSINVPEIDPEGECVRRRVDALDLGRTAWGNLKVVNSGGGGYYGGGPANIPTEIAQVLAKSLKRFRGSFVEIDVTDAPLTAEAMGIFAERVLKDNATLRVLKLSRSLLGGDGIAFLAGSLQRNPASPLTTISLNNVGMDDASFRRLCKVLQQEDSVPYLSELQIADNAITSLKPLSELVKSKHSLKELNIARLRSLKEVDGFGAALAESNVEHLLAPGTEANGLSKEVAVAVNANKLTKLHFQADRFNKSDYDDLGAAVGTSTTIRSLEVSLGNVNTMPSRKGFFSGLGRNTSLEELSMYQSRLQDESSMELADAIAKHPTLQKVSVKSFNNTVGPCAQNWATAIVNSTTLCELELETRWKDDALLLILEALPNSSSLKTFELRADGNHKLKDAVKARMEGDDARAEELIEQFCSGNAQKKELKREYDEQVAKQESVRIRDYATGDKVMVYPAADAPPVAGCVIVKTADNWYNVSRDDGEPSMRCTLKQIRPRFGHDLPVGSIVNAPGACGGREYRAKIVEVLPEAKYRVVPFWTVGSEKEAKQVERYQLTAVLPQDKLYFLNDDADCE